MIENDGSIPAKKMQRTSFFNSSQIAFSLKSGNKKHCLGTRKQIRDRSLTCPLCALVSRSIGDGWQQAIDPSFSTEFDDATCDISWEIDGRESVDVGYSRRKNRTRRIRLCWNRPELKKYESYLVFVAPERRTPQPNSDALSVSRKETHYLGRTIDPKKGKQALIKSWLDLCHSNHGPRCNAKLDLEDPFREVLSQSYFGVIDVIDFRLKSLPFKEEGNSLCFAPFAALSYVWGVPKKEKPYQTKRSNIMEHQKHGGLENVKFKFPKAIQDSIDLCQKLGIRYIWVDSLCIVQDSRRSFNLNSRVMHLIYGNATLTICAADGEDSSTGLIAMNPEHSTEQLKEECVPGVHLMISRPPEIGIQESRWNKRAWTFQERLLSRRCLIFTEGRIYFQCRSTGMSEDIFTDGRGTGWSLDSVHAPLQMLRELKTRTLWFYANCVSLYTSRDLTQPSDILAAFSGMCSLMQGKMMVPFIFGLPNSHFDFALLWEPEKSIKRRTLKPSNGESHDEEFPSWSWCGWIGANVQEFGSAKMLYNPDMVHGCMSNVREWLINHTWICWYIRDGHGNLRPLWDVTRAEEDQSTETRWKGYRGCHPSDRARQSLSRIVVEESEGYSSPPMSPKRSRSRSRSGRDVQLVRRERERRQERRNEFEGPPRPSGHYGLDNYEEEIIIRRGRSREREIDFEEDRRERNRLNQNYDFDRLGLYDAFGRAIWSEIRGRKQDDFSLTLPENPFRVLPAEGGYCAEPDKEFPDQPVLQFWTWKTSLHVVPSNNNEKNVGEGLCRCDIADGVGDWCGSIVVNEDWIGNQSGRDTMFEFIALSEARSFTTDECPVWTYYIPRERHESTWDLFFVLLVKYYPEKGLYERVALGKVFRAAFTLSGDEWKEIMLG